MNERFVAIGITLSPTTTNWRTHLALDEDAPLARDVQSSTDGRIVAIPHVGGPHHHYERHAA